MRPRLTTSTARSQAPTCKEPVGHHPCLQPLRSAALLPNTRLHQSSCQAALEKATSEIVLDGALEAPIRAGDTVGKLVVTVEGQVPTEAPIVAEATVKKLGFFGRAVEGLSQMIGGNDG